MINVTERAGQELLRILLKKVDMPQARLRLTYAGRGQLGLGIDIELPGDRVVEYNGAGIMVIEKSLATVLNDIVLDVDDTPRGPQLVFDEVR